MILWYSRLILNVSANGTPFIGENKSEGLVMAGKCSNSGVYPTLDKGLPVECGSLDPYFWSFGNCCNCRRRSLRGDVDLNIAAVVGKTMSRMER
jgi:hypothetical protein